MIHGINVLCFPLYKKEDTTIQKKIYPNSIANFLWYKLLKHCPWFNNILGTEHSKMMHQLNGKLNIAHKIKCSPQT